MRLDLLLDPELPGIVFLALCVWLVRMVVRAARTERDLEGQRLAGAFAEELQAAPARTEAPQRPALAAVPPASVPMAVRDAMDPADVRGAHEAHVRTVEGLVREAAGSGGAKVEVLWIRSNAAHVVWCERRPAEGANRDVIRIARIENGVVVERWSFG